MNMSPNICTKSVDDDRVMSAYQPSCTEPRYGVVNVHPILWVGTLNLKPENRTEPKQPELSVYSGFEIRVRPR
jgi:hypothetical protein